MVARRRLLAAGAAGGMALLLRRSAPTGSVPTSSDPDTDGLLDPRRIPKYVTELFIPPTLPATGGLVEGADPGGDSYRIAVRQSHQQVLPPGFPATTVWGYGAPDRPDTFHWPGPTIEARVDRPVQVTWANELTDGQGHYLPHLFAVDPRVHWANPEGGTQARDRAGSRGSGPATYTGPVPLVTHLHGAHSGQESDGYPEAWYLPAARDIPDGYAVGGSRYDEFRRGFADRHRSTWQPGSATHHYPNDQRATTLWYHDHTLGLTRLNSYAGLCGFYLLRGGPDDLPAGVLPGPDPDDPARLAEIPMVIQDRSFRRDGSLYYPGPDQPGSGFLANAIVVNGGTWPVLRVRPGRYRLRVLNGCNARFLILKIATNPTARPAVAVLPIWQIGSDGGFLPEPVALHRLPLASGERADVIVDFTGVPEGTALYLINEGPDAHPRGGDGIGAAAPAAPSTTGQVLKFQVGPAAGVDRSVPPEQLRLPPIRPLNAATVLRRLSLNAPSAGAAGDGYTLGLVGATGRGEPMRWHDPVTETPAVGATEIWELHNFTGEAHPIHLHQAQFQVVGRGRDGRHPPGPGERGFKDTVLVPPGEPTRIKVCFDVPGRYVWHCHNLEHEDREMMRPIHVSGRTVADPTSDPWLPGGATPAPPPGAPETGDGAMYGARDAGSGLRPPA